MWRWSLTGPGTPLPAGTPRSTAGEEASSTVGAGGLAGWMSGEVSHRTLWHRGCLDGSPGQRHLGEVEGVLPRVGTVVRSGRGQSGQTEHPLHEGLDRWGESSLCVVHVARLRVRAHDDQRGTPVSYTHLTLP